MTDLRAEFEKWCRDSYYSGMACPSDTWDDAKKTYLDVSHHIAYKAYQAAHKAAVPEQVADFIKQVAKQEPEKPDYWSSCGQCEHNISSAEDLLPLVATAPTPNKEES